VSTSLSSIGHDCWRKLASFAFESYLQSGIGVCTLRAQPGVKTKDAPLKYQPNDPDDAAFDKLPAETVTMLDEYDPQREVVFAIIDRDEKAVVVQLTAQKMGCAPIHAYRENQRKKGLGTRQGVGGSCRLFVGVGRAFGQGKDAEVSRTVPRRSHAAKSLSVS